MIGFFGIAALVGLWRVASGEVATTPLSKIEALYEPTETSVFVSDLDSYRGWNPLFSALGEHPKGAWHSEDDSGTVTLALTQERLYVVSFKPVANFQIDIVEFAPVPLSSISSWSFEKTKTTKGEVVGYSFHFVTSRTGQSVVAALWSEPKWAEPFMEHFTAAMGRYRVSEASVDIAAQLRALQLLVAEGVLTSAEMHRAKELFLGRAPDQRQLMERSLRGLYELRQSGVLTQIEYDIKKRDILARRD